MRTRSGSRYSNGGGEDALVGQKRKRVASAVAGECACCDRRKRPAGGPDYLDALPDDLVLSILTKVAADSSAPADLLSVHLTYVCCPGTTRFFINSSCPIGWRTLPSPSMSRGGRVRSSFAVYGNVRDKADAKDRALADVFGVCRCKRLNELGSHDMVFAKASPASLSVKAAAWSEAAQRFLKRSADAGNLEACYILGMVRAASQP
jgi:hypothetical protein